jgi:hypothetical protein
VAKLNSNFLSREKLLSRKEMSVLLKATHHYAKTAAATKELLPRQ